MTDAGGYPDTTTNGSGGLVTSQGALPWQMLNTSTYSTHMKVGTTHNPTATLAGYHD